MRLRRVQRRGLWMALACLALAALGPGGCSDESPGGEKLMAPAEREAAPVSETGLERTAQQRKEERLEEFNVAEQEPDDSGFQKP
jgi:hypothetical protein